LNPLIPDIPKLKKDRGRTKIKTEIGMAELDEAGSFKFDYKLLEQESRRGPLCRKLFKGMVVGCPSILMCFNLLLTVITLAMIGTGLEEIHRYKGVADNAKIIEHNVTHFMRNISTLRKDISVYSDLAAILIKHRSEIVKFFSFMNSTETFIDNAKDCINKYDVCPHMR